MSYFEEGLQLFRETKFKKSAELFIKALEEDSNNSEIYNYLGISKQALGFFEEAIAME